MHASYRCRHSGVCCTEGWPIPVEAPLYRTLHAALAGGAFSLDDVSAGPWLDDGAVAPPGAVAVARRTPRGCVFFEPHRGNLCAIHRQLGHQHLPSPCRHFPRVVVIDPRGAFVSLSHVCPTAAGLLMDGDTRPLDVVHEGQLFERPEVEGLDARDALPPQISPHVLWDWDALTCWDHGVLRLLAEHTAEAAIARLRRAARSIQQWRPGTSPSLATAVRSAMEQAHVGAAGAELDLERDVAELNRLARGSVVAASDAGDTLEEFDTDADRRLVSPTWPAFAGPVARYVAARAAANAVSYHASSARASAESVAVSYAVLRAECSRQCRQAQRPLDRELFLSALADADRLLVHAVSAAELAVRLDARVAVSGE